MTLVSGFPAGLASSAGNDMFNYADARIALTNSVTGNETPEELVEIQRLDKGLELKQEQAKFNYQYATAWQEQQDQLIQKNREQKKRLFDMGAIFA
jgi:hypothetical protein